MGNCGACGVSRQRFFLSRSRSVVLFERFGHELYFMPVSSKARNYASNASATGLRRTSKTQFLIVAAVVVGQSAEYKKNARTLKALSESYHSVHGVAAHDSVINYPEIFTDVM
ncbi:uncharacterized protein AMSG_00295 [Thecamonas trahens ATCC 50062]|uniref:Uncharacterized protein n=1 Tax=Thecamonas trahens ATCC 50062 TaxID=461836 RepID=A0A0L0D1U1_THETB|nr:hypothetical protein AMSG_00295 [Thecamonas trahens ATCC 50062]KNC46176.1 hypothetical protein AMSG_00295 [Thecamonas trahens ATCC 50062]|eukprot:XP_013763151.1 hypothetical protein AMSG_00295 [Thecamonas trahens ATCC 50062]